VELLEAHAEVPVLRDGVHREPARLVQVAGAQDHVGARQRDEAERVHAGLHHLPEVHVLVIEDVAVGVHVVHELRRERDADVVAAVDVAQHEVEEAARARLVGVKEADELVDGNLERRAVVARVLDVGVEQLERVVQVRRLAVQVAQALQRVGGQDSGQARWGVLAL
jgi:hypothetical protein